VQLNNKYSENCISVEQCTIQDKYKCNYPLGLKD